jgi:hypothetical protein
MNRRLYGILGVRLQTETFDSSGELQRNDEYYFLSSLPRCRLTPAHWLLVIRRHWGVETAHQALDVSFGEDDHPSSKPIPAARSSWPS